MLNKCKNYVVSKYYSSKIKMIFISSQSWSKRERDAY